MSYQIMSNEDLARRAHAAHARMRAALLGERNPGWGDIGAPVRLAWVRVVEAVRLALDGGERDNAALLLVAYSAAALGGEVGSDAVRAPSCPQPWFAAVQAIRDVLDSF